MTDPVRQALALAQGGRGADAVALLAAASDGDAHALLALWQVEGRLVPRNLGAARASLMRGAAAGSAGAARTLAGFLATGTGGERDWPAAAALLDDWADRDPLATRQRALIAAMALDAAGDPRAFPAPEPLSESPRVHRFPALFTADECAFLTEASASRFRPAQIFHETAGRFVEDPIRRSDVAAFPVVVEWPAIAALNRRIAAASGTDVRHGEPLQLLRYRPGQHYAPHLDAVPGLANQRRLTMLVWLNDDYDGGETRFLTSGLTVRGATGDGLLFGNVRPDGRPDPASRHEGCPVTRGEKRLASRWIRTHLPDAAGFGAREVQ